MEIEFQLRAINLIKLFSLILVLGLLFVGVAGGVPKTTWIDANVVTDPEQILRLECTYRFGSKFLYKVCEKKNLISYFFFGLSALSSLGIILAIYSLLATSLNLFYLKIVSDFSSNKEKVKQAESDSENTEEGQQASMRIFLSSLKWTVIFALIGLFFLFFFEIFVI